MPNFHEIHHVRFDNLITFQSSPGRTSPPGRRNRTQGITMKLSPSTRLRTHAMAAVTTLALALTTGQVAASGYPVGTPTPVPAGFSCRDFDTAHILRELTVSPLPDGPAMHGDGTLELATIYYNTTNGPILDWYQYSTGQSIHHVIIQGQNGGFAYSYDPIVDTDRNLHGDLVQPDPLVKPAYEPLRSATFCYSLPQQNFNGCTLGYWKQSQHFDSWPADIAPSHSLRNHFGPNAYADTLLNALDYKGGAGVEGAKRLLQKQAVAALLNASSSQVDYRLSRSEVQQFVTFALNSNDRDVMLGLAATLDAYNNQGCPLN
jgi:hypothetical protein